MKYDLHEKILLFLFDKRKSSEYFDLLAQFSGEKREVLNSIILELEKKKYIEVTRPFIGIGVMDMSTGKLDIPKSEEDFLKARLTSTGIDHIKKELRTNKDWLDIAYKITAIVGVLGTIILGFISLQQSSTVDVLEHSNDSLASDITVLNSYIKMVDSVANTYEKKFYFMRKERDSLHQIVEGISESNSEKK